MINLPTEYQRLHAFSPDQAVTPALLAYEGIQYQHIAPSVFTDAQWHYVMFTFAFYPDFTES